jgi:hypothetical protein
MGQKSTAFESKVTQVGFWNYNEVYEMLYGWLKDHGYGVKETSYKEKISGGSKEINISWKAGRGVTDYFKYEITLEWHIMGLKDAEVEVEGKKVKTNKGELEIAIKAFLVKDYESRWEDTPFYKFMRGLYENYIIRTTLEEYEGGIGDDGEALVAELKSFLRMPTN